MICNKMAVTVDKCINKQIPDTEVEDDDDEYDDSDDDDYDPYDDPNWVAHISNPIFSAHVNKFFDELKSNGIRCEKNFTCCDKCGRDGMRNEKDYVFYTSDVGDLLREGLTKLYLTFELESPDKRRFVKSIISKYGEWNGNDEIKILLKMPDKCVQ